jgi:hypothetical protein
MPELYDSPELEAIHLKAMQALAAETGHAFAMVKEVYETELAKLQATAHVSDFVVLLSSRKAREALRKPAKSRRSQPVTA